MSLVFMAGKWIAGSISRKPLAWVIGVSIAVIIALAALVYHAGEENAARVDARTAVTQSLSTNTAQIVAAAPVAAAAHAAVDTAHQASLAASAHRDTALTKRAVAAVHEARARSRVAITGDTSVSIDSAPPIAAPAVVVSLIRQADTLRAADSVALQVDSSALAAASIERTALVADTVAIGAQRDLYHQRSDTLEKALAIAEDASGCGKLCKLKRAAVGSLVLYGAWRLGLAIVREVKANGTTATAGGTLHRVFF